MKRTKKELQKEIVSLENTIKDFDRVIDKITQTDVEFICIMDMKIMNTNIIKPETEEDFKNVNLILKSFHQFMNDFMEIKTSLKTKGICGIMETMSSFLKEDIKSLKEEIENINN